MTRLVAALLALLAAGLAAAQDRIEKVDGSVLPPPGGRPIEVIQETIREVRYRLQGLSTPLRIPAGEVKAVRYGRAPQAYREAEEAFKDQAYLDAVASYQAALKHTGAYRWLRQHALYRIGLAYAAAGEHDRAVAAFRELLKKIPETRFLPQAHLGIVRSLFISRGAAAAGDIRAELDRLQAALRKYRLPKRWQYEIRYWQLRVAAAQGKDVAADAEALAREAESEHPAVANRARILVGRSLLGKDLKRAREYFLSVLRRAPKDAHGVKAAALYGLGLCIFRSSTEKDTKSYQQAREFFLRAVVLGTQHPERVDGEVLADSLIHAAKCFKILRKEDKLNLLHADRLLRAVEQRFPGTVYAKRAAAERRRT